MQDQWEAFEIGEQAEDQWQLDSIKSQVHGLEADSRQPRGGCRSEVVSPVRPKFNRSFRRILICRISFDIQQIDPNLVTYLSGQVTRCSEEKMLLRYQHNHFVKVVSSLQVFNMKLNPK